MARKKKAKAEPTPAHVERHDCWCQPVWVHGRVVAGRLLHRPEPFALASLTLEMANRAVGAPNGAIQRKGR